MTESDLYDFLRCFKIDDFYRKILLYNISKNKTFVIDGLVDFTLSNDLSIIEDSKVQNVVRHLKKVENSDCVVDRGKLSLSINKLEYYCKIIRANNPRDN